jgi:hypothetical protein
VTHLSMEALLNLREPGSEPGTAASREHVEQCPQCRAELDRLHQRVARLKALPSLRPARDRWPQTVAKYRAERNRRRAGVGGLVGLAAAASIALAIGIKPAPPDSTVPALTTSEIELAKERSQALENALSAFNPEARVLDCRTAGISQELEERIAQVDRELEATELLRQQARDSELLKLWRERVGLLDALVDVHITRASNAGL